MVEIPTYVLPNRVGYLNYLFNHFHPKEYAYSDTVKYPHQKFVKDYLHHDTPYKGLYLYFLPGTGKTKASLEVIKSFHDKGKHAFVFLPASLEENYRKEITKFGYPFKNYRKKPFWFKIGTNKKTAPDVLKVLKDNYHSKLKYTIKDGILWLWNLQDNVADMITSKGANIILKGVKYEDVDDVDKIVIDIMINSYINLRYTFVHYNGLNDNVISKIEGKMDNSIIVFDEIHKFILTVSNKRPLAIRLYNAVVQAKNSKMLLLSGTPLINKPFELANLINMVRGPTTTYVFKVSLEKRSMVIKNLRESDIWFFIDTYRFQEEDLEIILLPFPFVKESKTEVSVKSDIEKWKKNKNIVEMLKKVVGSRSSKIMTNNQLPFPNNEEDFNKIFLKKKDKNTKPVFERQILGSVAYNGKDGDDYPEELPPIIETINMPVFERQILGSVAYYGREGDDYPEELPPIIEKINMSKYQFEKYMFEREIEIKQEDMNRLKKQRKKENEITETYMVFSRMACNFVFPPGIDRPKPSLVKKNLLVELSKVGFEDDEEDDENNKKIATPLSRDKKDPVVEYQRNLKKTVDRVNDMKVEDFNIDDYSPKYKRILENIEKGVDQKALVYSQFRTVEGIGMFAVYLRKMGYVEIKLKNTKDGYILDDPDILHQKYDHKRFCIFDDERMKTSTIINVYNGKFSELNNTLRKQIGSREENLRGSLAKIMLITGSAAEGISFFNVRSVHIMEPYWNNMVIEQVIGRAIRNRSHINLPKEDRTVQAYRYIMQVKSNNNTFKMRDDNSTTDQIIQSLADSKSKINDPFIQALIKTSINCAIHAKTQKNRCYDIPLNLNPSKVIQMDTVQKEMSNLPELKLATRRNVRGIYKDGVVKADYDTSRDFDVDGFVYAKQLIEKQDKVVTIPKKVEEIKETKEKKVEEIKETKEKIPNPSPHQSKSSSKSKSPPQSKSSTKFTLVDVSGSGNCFPKALYGALKNNKGNMLKIFAGDLKLPDTALTNEDVFVKAFRKRFATILRSNEDTTTTTTFNMLKELGDMAKRYLADEFYGEGANITSLKNIGMYPIPKTERTFREKLARYIEQNRCYLNSLYINTIIDELSKNVMIRIESENSYIRYVESLEKIENIVVLVRVNQNHYNYVLFK